VSDMNWIPHFLFQMKNSLFFAYKQK